MFIGDVIRKYRRQIGITQEEMARRNIVAGSIISAIGMLAGSLWNKKTLRQDKGDPQGV